MSAPTLESHPLARAGGPAQDPLPRRRDWRQVLGWILIAAGAVGVLVAWYGISGTVDPGEQMPYLASGGMGGGGAIAVGVTLLISYEHARDRAALRLVLERIYELERRLDALVPGEAADTPAEVPR